MKLPDILRCGMPSDNSITIKLGNNIQVSCSFDFDYLAQLLQTRCNIVEDVLFGGRIELLIGENAERGGHEPGGLFDGCVRFLLLVTLDNGVWPIGGQKHGCAQPEGHHTEQQQAIDHDTSSGRAHGFVHRIDHGVFIVLRLFATTKLLGSVVGSSRA